MNLLKGLRIAFAISTIAVSMSYIPYLSEIRRGDEATVPETILARPEGPEPYRNSNSSFLAGEHCWVTQNGSLEVKKVHEDIVEVAY